jgi:hypothetical protein
MRKGSKEAKAWGRKMQRLRGKPKTKRRKTTTRKRRTTRKGMLTLTRKRAYSRRKKSSESAWSF